jgi:hypothetical protein
MHVFIENLQLKKKRKRKGLSDRNSKTLYEERSPKVTRTGTDTLTHYSDFSDCVGAAVPTGLRRGPVACPGAARFGAPVVVPYSRSRAFFLSVALLPGGGIAGVAVDSPSVPPPQPPAKPSMPERATGRSRRFAWTRFTISMK